MMTEATELCNKDVLQPGPSVAKFLMEYNSIPAQTLAALFDFYHNLFQVLARVRAILQYYYQYIMMCNIAAALEFAIISHCAIITFKNFV